VFLPAFCLAALLFVQEPTPFTVTTGGGTVAPAAVAEVRTAVAGALAELRADFPGLPRQPFTVSVHADEGALPPAVAEHHHPGSPGLALLEPQQIHVLWREMRREPGGVRAVVKHEVVHILLHQLGGPFAGQIPRWFHEGLAQTLAGDSYLGAREQDIIWRASTDRLLHFSELVDGFPERPADLQLAYAQSHSYVAFLVHRHGLRRLLDAVRMLDRDTTFLRALVRVTDETTMALQDAWIDYLLHGSGATWRVLLDMCFPLSMVLALPILAMAMIRRQRADRSVQQRWQQREQLEADDGPLPEPDLPGADEDDPDQLDAADDADEDQGRA
jgi:hypothetical protein